MIVNRNNDAFFPGQVHTGQFQAELTQNVQSDILRALHDWSDRINAPLMARRYDEFSMPRIEFEHRPLWTDSSIVSVPASFHHAIFNPVSMIGSELSGVATKMKYDEEKTKQDKNAKFLFIVN